MEDHMMSFIDEKRFDELTDKSTIPSKFNGTL